MSSETAVREAIETLREEEGLNVATAKRISKETDYSPKQVAPVLTRLEADGVVQRWGTSSPHSWVLYPDNNPAAP